MPRYYFDTHDDGELTPDEDGLEFDDLEAVKLETARALTEIAKDVVPGSTRRVLAITVRDGTEQAVVEARLVFEMSVIR
jgi:hypothetical protein